MTHNEMSWDLAAAIERRLREQREAAARRRQDRAAYAARKKRARDAGLRSRHARKINRSRRGT